MIRQYNAIQRSLREGVVGWWVMVIISKYGRIDGYQTIKGIKLFLPNPIIIIWYMQKIS
jgi:hypothetical protein